MSKTFAVVCFSIIASLFISLGIINFFEYDLLGSIYILSYTLAVFYSLFYVFKKKVRSGRICVAIALFTVTISLSIFAYPVRSVVYSSLTMLAFLLTTSIYIHKEDNVISN